MNKVNSETKKKKEKRKWYLKKNTVTPVFNAASFTIVKIWEQPKCPSTDE